MNIGIILLAAGNSSRLGAPKQLLRIGHQNLLTHTLQVATSVQAAQVVLVLGAYADEIIPEISPAGVTIVQNEGWEEGIASSIRAGFGAFSGHKPFPDAVICMVCDQPYIDHSLLETLIASAESTQKGIIASQYGDTYGTPALFREKYFEDLRNLQGNNGARQLFGKYAGDLLAVPFSKGAIDIDTRKDYEQLLRREE